MRNFNAEEANIHIKDLCDLCKLKNVIIKVQHVLKSGQSQDYWQTQSVFKTPVYLKHVFLTFIKWLFCP